VTRCPVLSTVLAVLAVLAACSGGSIKLCGEIPKDGCPSGRGGTCADQTCAGLYDCVDGEWIQLERCSSGIGKAGSEASDAGPEGSCEAVTIDHQGETTGCLPDLQNPDCPAAAAESCTVAACLTGCLDFFLCTKDGWTEVAYCDEQGRMVVSP
jgi:hypothetical protein